MNESGQDAVKCPPNRRNAPQTRWPSLRLSPHPLAPTFSKDSNPQLILQQLAVEAASPTFRPNEKILRLLREAGFVSLWFYLKFIAGASGPYNLLNTDLHVDMCNFRQRVAEEPGIKAMGLVPRACYKSTTWSHGPNSWELLRDPNLRIGCTSQIYDRALSFVQQTIATFTANELHKLLYPEYAKANRSGVDLVLENRTRRYPEPNLQALTAGGSTQGIHVDLFDCDDIVGEDMLNSEHVAGADMARMGNWLYSNLRTLVVSWLRSRVMVVGTRYAIDDPYERGMKSARAHLGYWAEMESNYPLDPEGDWVVYYRPAIQTDADGNEYSINPEAFTVKQIHELLVSDPWVAQSQYMNNPIAAGASDFGQYTPKTCSLQWDDGEEAFYLLRNDDKKRISLKDCCVMTAGDPSGGGTHASANASRAAVATIVRDSSDTIYIIEAEAGYVAPTKFVDWLFEKKAKYNILVRHTVVETQGPFKSLISFIRQEENQRKKFLNFLPTPALGDKETTIRNILQPYLERNKLYIRDAIYGKVMEELRVFPSKKMDLLDAIKLAVFKSTRPEEYIDDDEDNDDMRPRRRSVRDGVSPVTGY